MNKHSFGEPSTGFHATRFMGMALYDILGTIGLALIFSYFTGISIWVSLLGWFVAGEILHWYYGVETAFIKLFTNSAL
jgi:hypothetical protein